MSDRVGAGQPIGRLLIVAAIGFILGASSSFLTDPSSGFALWFSLGGGVVGVASGVSAWGSGMAVWGSRSGAGVLSRSMSAASAAAVVGTIVVSVPLIALHSPMIVELTSGTFIAISVMATCATVAAVRSCPTDDLRG